jgi:hypothetical protein
MGMRRITDRPGRADSEDFAQSQAPAARRPTAGGMLKAECFKRLSLERRRDLVSILRGDTCDGLTRENVRVLGLFSLLIGNSELLNVVVNGLDFHLFKSNLSLFASAQAPLGSVLGNWYSLYSFVSAPHS